MLPQLTFVIGGAASGKSRHAEGLATDAGRPRRYIATAQALDPEMRARVDRHKARRSAGWTTVEAPTEAAAALNSARPGEIVLFDCATLWLSNHLLAESDLPAETERLIAALAACPAPVVLVSNEVGAGIVPDNALSRTFREEQGRLNQRLAAEAGLVIAVTAGLPVILKGAPPETGA